MQVSEAARSHCQFYIEVVCRRFASIKVHALASISMPALARALTPPNINQIAISSALALGLFNAAAEIFNSRVRTI